MVTLREASAADAAEMARIQSTSLRQNGRDVYTEEQLNCLAPPDPGADIIPDAEFTDNACHPIVAEEDGAVVGWGSVHVSEKHWQQRLSTLIILEGGSVGHSLRSSKASPEEKA